MDVMFYTHEMAWLDQFQDFDKMQPIHHKRARALRKAMIKAGLTAQELSDLTFTTDGPTLSHKWVLMAMVGIAHSYEDEYCVGRLAPLLGTTAEELLNAK